MALDDRDWYRAEIARRQPMTRCSSPPPFQGTVLRARLLVLVLVLAGLTLGWFVASGLYRRQHCVELFGHWIAVDRGPSLFCEGFR